MEKELAKTYFDPANKGSYGGLKRLWGAVKDKGYAYRDVKNWLESQESYGLHKPRRTNFTRQRVRVSNIDEQWQADLVDIPDLVNQNKGYRYILTVIDVFSKYAWVVLLKAKTGIVVRDAFAAIFKEGRIPKRLQTDNGTEFYNSKVDSLLKEHKIELFSTYNNETKASVVERYNRTLKTDMWHYFTANNTRRYVDIIQDLVSAYNNRTHRSIKMTPVAVTKDNTSQVFANLYGRTLKVSPKEKNFAPGDLVVITKSKRLFEKGYLPNWTYEQFTVTEVIPSTPVRYRIKDYADEVLDGTFYGAELQKTVKREKFHIEKVVRRSKNKVLVKWWGSPDSMNSWVPAKNVHKINKVPR